jgi:hypothetical protein
VTDTPSPTDLVPVGAKPEPKKLSRTFQKKIRNLLRKRALPACASTRFMTRHPRYLGEKLPDGRPLFTKREIRAYNRMQMMRESRRRNRASSVFRSRGSRPVTLWGPIAKSTPTV